MAICINTPKSMFTALLYTALIGCDVPAHGEISEAGLESDEIASELANDANSAELVGDEPISGEPESFPLSDVLNPALWNPFDVAVLSNNGSCPINSTWFSILLDTEDDNNNNSKSGWTGNSRVDSHFAKFWFCAVDGSQFQPLSSVSAHANHYMVLKLGTNCPNNSVLVRRFFDTQNSDDQSYSNDGDGPNNKSGTGLWLNFCMFRSGVAIMKNFPVIAQGFQYGVFARDFSKALDDGSGNVFTDDEDDANANAYEAKGYEGDAGYIISGGANTRLYMSRVR